MSEQRYKELLIKIISDGEDKSDRTGVGTRSIFGATLQYDLTESFPLFTAKKLNFPAIVGELLWFISGSTNVYDLAYLTYGTREKKTIWHDNAFAPYWRDYAKKVGDLGQIYGAQWRKWPYIARDGSIHYKDQIEDLMYELENNPNSRRLMLQSYSPNQIQELASIPACHNSAQFYVRQKKYLDCAFYMRSNDMLLGHPYNVASYALLTYILAAYRGLTPGTLTFNGGDCHIYNNHLEAIEKYLKSPISDKLPKLEVDIYAPQKDDAFSALSYKSILPLTALRQNNFILTDYDPGPVITAPMAV